MMACDINDWCAEGTTISVSKHRAQLATFVAFFGCLMMLQAEFISSVAENL